MKYFLVAILFSFQSLVVWAQLPAWYIPLKQSTIVDIDSLRPEKGTRWSKHFERYYWNERWSKDENGRYVSPNERVLAEINRNERAIDLWGNWTPIGLTEWINGNSGYNPGNGRVNAITVDPSNSDVIYACASSGGLWKSTDGGQTWNTNTDQFPILGTSDLAVDPQNSNVLYLATGDRDGLDTYGVGVYKSTDGGASWNPTGLFSTYDSESLIINALEIDPNNSQIIFAGSRSGLHKSIDGGATWTTVISGKNIMQIRINPLRSQTVYAVSTQNFYRSYNGGESFQIITNGIQTSIGRIAMDITPADTSYIYLLLSSSGSDFNGVYRSIDGGSSFDLQFDPSQGNLLGYSVNADDDASQAWYDLALAAHPQDKEKVYIGGVNVWASEDGGLSFQINTHWYLNGTYEYSHADIHSLDFYGTSLYCGSDGGAFKTDDGYSWSNISSGLNISQIYRFSNSPDGQRISTGCQDNGTNVSISGTWKHVMGADGMDNRINPSNPQQVYLSYQYGVFLRSNVGGDNSSTVFSPADYGEEGEWVTPIDMCQSQPNQLVVGLKQVYKTIDSGENWDAISSFTDNEPIITLAIAPSDPNYIYVSKENHFYYTTDGGAVWNETGNPMIKPVVDISVSANSPSEVYVLMTSSYAKAYKSTNSGYTFTAILGSLTQMTGHSIANENNSEHGVYVGTEFGVYYTNDNLSSWILFANQLPKVKVSDLQIVGSKLRAATYGRGVWESDLYQTFVNVDGRKIMSQSMAYPNPASEFIYFNIPNDELNKVELYSAAGQLVRTWTNLESKISIAHLPQGAYFVKVLQKSGAIHVERILKD